MKVQNHTVVTVSYRFLDKDGKEIHSKQSFKANFLIGTNHTPSFIEKELLNKSVGSIIRLHLPYDEEVVSGMIDPIEININRLPNGLNPLPGMIVSYVDRNNVNHVIKIIEVSDNIIKGIPVSGNPEKPQYMEITIQSVRWATPEEFIEGKPKKSH